ncbi:MAG TPA: hypothetical protein VGB82_19120 [Alphaproteobacteria bacterium]
MGLFQRKRIDQVGYFRALEARYLSLAYLTSHEQQAAFYVAIAGDYAELADAAVDAERKASAEAAPAPATEAVSAVA